ncbi:MAG TPA: inositol monophosphatase family protein [Beijerinckiaceae bacterium]|nr:inositol monophosphatase family protein [Beijerinckiaceae bacterium]
MDTGLRLSVACAVAREAGLFARKAFRNRPRTLSIDFKGEQDFLSATDSEVERLIRTRLQAAFPDDAFFGEEGGGELTDRVWIVDPIDGTANFLRGNPEFCVSIGFVREGRTEVGVIYAPMQDELYAAARGHGATLDGEPMRVSGLTDIRQSTIEAGWSTRLPLPRYVEMVRRLTEVGAGFRRGGSGAIALANVAAGRLDAYCELHMNAWDGVAGLLLIEEAGGYVSDFLGGNGLREGNPILGCTPALTKVLREVMGVEV